jgi:tRNA(His) 5'-end guanylyltransferase
MIRRNKNTDDNKICNFPIFSDFSTKSCDFTPKIAQKRPKGQSASMAHFVAFRHSFWNNTPLPFWSKQGLLVIQRPNIYW